MQGASCSSHFFYILCRLRRKVGGSSASATAGHIVAGVLLGPPVADLIPSEDFMRLVGKLGILLYVIEGGLDLKLAELRSHAARAAAAAFVGVVFPLLLTVGLLGSGTRRRECFAERKNCSWSRCRSNFVRFYCTLLSSMAIQTRT